MELENDKWKVINEAIDHWAAEGKISAEQAEQLRASYTLRKPAQQIAQYFFLFALSCTLMAFGAIFIDEKFLERIRLFFDLSHLTIAILMTGIAGSWFYYLHRKKPQQSSRSYELYQVLGGLASMTALVYYCKVFGFGANYSGFLFAAMCVLGILAAFFRSAALWLGTLAATALWYAGFTTTFSQNNLFLGMNYPVRYVLLGAVVLGCSFFIRGRQLDFTKRITFLAGLVLLFISLWAVSVFGNFASFQEWLEIRQTRVLGYSLLFAAASLTALYMGVRYKDDVARDLGILFLLLNFYSRYFEFFWKSLHKGLFFLVLAVSFFFVGKLIEKRKKLE